MRPRLVLHLAALVLPVASVVVTLLVLDGRLSSDRASGSALIGTGGICIAAVLAAQIAAAVGAPLLLRTESRWLLPLSVGFGMSLATYALFAPLYLLVMGLTGYPVTIDDLIKGAPIIAMASALVTGWVTAPLVMVVSVLVDRLQRRELVRAVA